MNEQTQPVADDEIDLWDLLATLVDARWLIVGVTAVVTVLGLLYALLATPVYRADALLQIEQEASPFAGLTELSQAMSGEAPVAGEIEILRSRSVVGGAIETLNLQTVVEPRRLPVVGGRIARGHDGDEPSSLFGYALGGEKLGISRLSVPDALVGKELTLEARGAGAYRLLGPDGERLLEGAVGKAASGAGVELFVDELRANEGTRFTVVQRNFAKAYRSVRGALGVSEKGRQTGILELTYEADDPRQAAEVLNAIAREFVRQNVERRSEEASQTLAFINQQLPELKSNLDAAEARLNLFRTARGTVDLTLETQAVLEQAAAIEQRINEFELQRAELRQRYTENHPTVTALNEQIAQVQSEQARLNAAIRDLPEAERESVAILRDVRVANELYMLLLNRAQELRVVEAGTVGNARIVDAAIPPIEPVKPRKALVVLLSVMLGGVLGVMLAFARRALARGIEDPREIERHLGIPVYAVIPISEEQQVLDAQLADAKPSNGVDRLLADSAPQDLAVEALRSLRTALQFGMLDAANNVIAIGGPTEGVGKSFVAANLAAVLADAGKRVLLIDGDLRRGHVHKLLGAPRDGGLSEVIGSGLARERAIRSAVRDGLDFIATGVLPPNPSELLLNARFRDFLDAAAKDYDMVVIDAPPVLAVTDGAIIAGMAGTNFLVLRFGENTLREVEIAVKRLEQSGVKVQGIIMNGVTKRASARGYRQYGYHYAYSYGKK